MATSCSNSWRLATLPSCKQRSPVTRYVVILLVVTMMRYNG